MLEKDINARIETGEFICLCPWTGLPDFAYVIINYTSAESVVNNILRDFVKTVKPKEMFVNMEFGIRGGLIATVSAEYLSRETKEK
jgi:7-cyano-7-deazaguanine reductase